MEQGRKQGESLEESNHLGPVRCSLGKGTCHHAWHEEERSKSGKLSLVSTSGDAPPPLKHTQARKLIKCKRERIKWSFRVKTNVGLGGWFSTPTGGNSKIFWKERDQQACIALHRAKQEKLTSNNVECECQLLRLSFDLHMLCTYVHTSFTHTEKESCELTGYKLPTKEGIRLCFQKTDLHTQSDLQNPWGPHQDPTEISVKADLVGKHRGSRRWVGGEEQH